MDVLDFRWYSQLLQALDSADLSPPLSKPLLVHAMPQMIMAQGEIVEANESAIAALLAPKLLTEAPYSGRYYDLRDLPELFRDTFFKGRKLTRISFGVHGEDWEQWRDAEIINLSRKL
jgi:hypothetical protein